GLLGERAASRHRPCPDPAWPVRAVRKKCTDMPAQNPVFVSTYQYCFSGRTSDHPRVPAVEREARDRRQIPLEARPEEAALAQLRVGACVGSELALARPGYFFGRSSPSSFITS